MEIKCISSQGEKTWFSFRCSACHKDIDKDDKFCRSCGAKLSPLPSEISMSEASNILTRELKNKTRIVADGAASLSERGDILEFDKSKGPLNCPRLKETPAGCEFFCGGECHGVVFPTCPPQYKDCVYFKRSNQ